MRGCERPRGLPLRERTLSGMPAPSSASSRASCALLATPKSSR